MSLVCCKIHQRFSKFPKFKFPFEMDKLPHNGIYVLFEAGEYAHQTDRIVRIGTHVGNYQLLSRLEQHFIREKKDRSIFRKNIGRAILNRSKDPFLAHWNMDLTTSEAKKKHVGMIDEYKLQSIEKLVTNYIQHNFQFSVIRVDKKEERLLWESKLISTISLCDECRPSINWLGLYSPISKIRESGLWQVNELYKHALVEEEYGLLETCISGKQ